MDKDKYEATLFNEITDCLEEEHKHAVLVVFNEKNGQVKTYAVNAEYDMVRMLVGSIALLVHDDNEERTIN